MTSYGLEYSFGLLGSAVPAVSPPAPCAPPASSLVGWVRSRKGLEAVQALLSYNENIPVLATLFSAQIQDIALC